MEHKKSFTDIVYRNYITTHFGSINQDIDRAYRSRFYLWKSYFLRLLPKNFSAHILEIGCGMGHNLYALRELGYRNVTGFDISKECTDFCKRKGFQTVWGTDIAAFAERKKYKTKFDFIVIYDLLEHFSPDEALAFLHALRSLSARNGKIFISVPNGEFPLNMPQRFIDISHAFLYTSTSLSQLFHLSNMEAVCFGSVPSFSLADDNFLKFLIKYFVMQPLSEVSLVLLRVFLATFGMTLKHPKPQLFSLSRFV